MKRPPSESPAASPAAKPRICLSALFLQNHLGGIGIYTHRLVTQLAADHPEWDITLMTHRGAAKNFRDIPGIRLAVFPSTSFALRFAFFHAVFPFFARRFALVHSVGNIGMILCASPQAITIHDSYEHLSPERFSPLKRALMRVFISRSGAAARRIFTNSENTRRTVERFYPHLAGKIVTTFLGNKFPPRPGKPAAEREGFLYVGTLEPGKNLPLALEAFARFRRETGAGTLRVVGAMGWKQSGIPALLAKLDLGESVKFLGYVPEARLEELYASSLALIQCSTYEGFGLSVVEAMACGCPAIVAHNSGLVEAGGDAALFFRTHDAGDLLARMREIHADPTLREDRVRLGLEHAARFTWEKCAAETAREYRALLGA